MVFITAIVEILAEPEEEAPVPPEGGGLCCSGASRYVIEKNFLVFLMFSNICEDIRA